MLGPISSPNLNPDPDQGSGGSPWPSLHGRRLRQLGGWLVLGVVAVGVEIGLIGALFEGLHLPLWSASALAAEALILLRFAIADRWVFGHRQPTLGRLARYQGASLGALVVSWLVLNGSAALLGISYVLATLLGTGASFAWSLLTNFRWVWKPKQGRSAR